MEKKNALLKVVSIILLIGGIISLIICILSALGGWALYTTGQEYLVLLLFGVVGIIGSVFQIITSISGIRAANGKGKIKTAKVLGIITLVFGVLSIISVFVNGGSFSDNWTKIFDLVLPILYMIGVVQAEK